jgi:hypothetical protein
MTGSRGRKVQMRIGERLRKHKIYLPLQGGSLARLGRLLSPQPLPLRLRLLVRKSLDLGSHDL